MNTIYIQNVIYTIYMNNYFVNLKFFYNRKIQYLHVTVNNSTVIISSWEKCFIFRMICILNVVCDLNPAAVLLDHILVAFLLFVQGTTLKYLA